ncbi:class I SAM-dependent methyltransferase [Schinkia azotoformans]|uniref:Type 12 methyltransferase n=1 Tax=Schinkia azotoformans LMG 9581 TaxID=1131731 RepID=K6BV40_SCHAZ|nr:class I SAM-dependent methyltransferase [Schinkia azotoformans]EKN62795.1 type 12 methyltransferase [Schinkia azotoformans LMG 9581]MEC1639170.1 class I SAM-dependent methyltransferase [Schinkia azotoformans]MEC1945758.1 class I SAM-dependent methyltransferase [Schinkia azotoformans]
MKQQIGNVNLNLAFYTGQDQYSDGDIEDELLEIVKKYEDYEIIIKNDNRWPILYHLSKYRANIIEWYPMSKDKTVLEIGAGCGAITGVLCEKTHHVTAVELSKKRSMINAYRHKSNGNLEIIVGDLNKIEFTEQYDYITLIGVLEYASLFTEGKTPFFDFLMKIKQLLKPGGKLFIAIENKYGLKYWAGAREDHTGRFFDSIEGYSGEVSARTFSKRELMSLLENVGFSNQQYYYPIPDYKLPFRIYSDERLPHVGELRDLIHNYDQQRFQLFNESVAFDEIIVDGNFPFFSNSFLVVCGS